jgi:hypothetical protein
MTMEMTIANRGRWMNKEEIIAAFALAQPAGDDAA